MAYRVGHVLEPGAGNHAPDASAVATLGTSITRGPVPAPADRDVDRQAVQVVVCAQTGSP